MSAMRTERTLTNLTAPVRPRPVEWQSAISHEDAMKRILAILLFCASIASAETGDVPRLANGKIDVIAVMSSFKAQRPVVSGSSMNEFEGEMLQKPFHATYTQTTAPAPFVLTIRTSDLSEDATYLTAVLLTDLICLGQDRGAAPVKWEASSVKIENGWQVMSACSAVPRVPVPSDG